MCEYCGCQSVTVIDDLTREHDEVVTLIQVRHPAGVAGADWDAVDAVRRA